MADKLAVTGQYNLVNGVTNQNAVSYDLAKLFGTVENILEHNKIKRQIVTGDGVVSLDKGGVGTMRGFIIAITDGSGDITLKHDGNTNGMTVEGVMILHGSFDNVTIETASSQPLTVEYMFFE